MSDTIPQSVSNGCRKYVKSRIIINTFNTFNNVNRYVVVRNQWGQESPYIYNIGRRKMSVKLGNIIRAVYAFQTTSNYFQAYPILLSHWLKLDDYHKITGYKAKYITFHFFNKNYK